MRCGPDTKPGQHSPGLKNGEGSIPGNYLWGDGAHGGGREVVVGGGGRGITPHQSLSPAASCWLNLVPGAGSIWALEPPKQRNQAGQRAIPGSSGARVVPWSCDGSSSYNLLFHLTRVLDGGWGWCSPSPVTLGHG